MLKTLISNSDAEQNSVYCNFLAGDKELEIVCANDSDNTLNKYFAIEPDLFILDSNVKDMNYTEIIDRISAMPTEKLKCNTIVTVNKLEDKCKLRNTAKIYKIFNKPFELEELSDTINVMKNEINTRDITIEDIDIILLQFHINIGSNGARYIESAIQRCYYYPSLLHKLDDVFKDISYQYNVTASTVRESIRSTLAPLNRYGIPDVTDQLLALLDTKNNITPKFFLSVVTTYMRNLKRNMEYN